MVSRHHRQTLFPGLGPDGQAALARSSVLVAGVGATGGTVAQLLVRSGVGRVRVVDSDVPEIGNLGRQLLYNEASAASGRPKALLARDALRAMNSDVLVEGIVARVGPDNIQALAQDVDLIMDGLDNQESRYVVNDWAAAAGIPWVWTGAVGSAGNVLAIHPGQTPCLRCLFPQPAPPGSLPSTDTVGIIGPAASAAGSIAAALAMKILSGQPVTLPARLITFDLWSGSFHEIPIHPDPHCPACGGGRNRGTPF
jgi:adenylyltransferase/sulfurtransferase